jgi:FtsZ-binding cell division protein ZapB
LFLRSIEETITISRKEYDNLKQENAELKQQLSGALSMIRDLQIEIQFLKNGRKSDTVPLQILKIMVEATNTIYGKRAIEKVGGKLGIKGVH